jgi:peptidyl-prolyl cis-trans isomerase B (cyclophilin B)
LGVIFGFIALSQIRRTGDEGIGMAVTGIICGSLWIIFAITAMIVWGVTYPGSSYSSF